MVNKKLFLIGIMGFCNNAIWASLKNNNNIVFNNEELQLKKLFQEHNTNVIKYALDQKKSQKTPFVIAKKLNIAKKSKIMVSNEPFQLDMFGKKDKK